MDGWMMDGWMDGWMDGRTEGWMDGWMMDGWMDGWMDGRTDGRRDGWMDGWMDGVKNTGSTARDHLANERTFLAWLRTGLSLVGAGFGIIKLLPDVSSNFVMGFALITVGVFVLLYSAARYFDVMQSLEQGEFSVDIGGIVLVVVAAGLLEFLVICIVLDHLWNHQGLRPGVG
eukprot:s4217_g6.t1